MYLLSHTVEGVWKKTDDFNIEISEEKLKQWPEKGDLADLIPKCNIVKEDVNDEDEDEEGKSDGNKKNKDLFDADGQDEGPAPLKILLFQTKILKAH